jgi:hypothetical protein
MATGASTGWRYPVPAVTTSLTACAVQNVETKNGRRSPERDRLTAMGVVDSNMVVEDARREPFGSWDGSRLPTSTEPVATGSHVEPRNPEGRRAAGVTETRRLAPTPPCRSAHRPALRGHRER